MNDWVRVTDRRRYIGSLVDGILGYWLAGTHDEELREWWTTDEASSCALELAHVMNEVVESKGFAICEPQSESGNEQKEPRA